MSLFLGTATIPHSGELVSNLFVDSAFPRGLPLLFQAGIVDPSSKFHVTTPVVTIAD